MSLIMAQPKENSSYFGNLSSDFIKKAVLVIFGIIILILALAIAYRYSQQKTGSVMLPGGITYLGATKPPENQPQTQPTTAPKFTVDTTIPYATQSGKIYPYSFPYPITLPLVVFPQDKTDSVGIAWGDIPPQQNILLNMEFIDKRDASAVAEPKIEYVRNWYSHFPGLKGVASVETFTNAHNLKGYRAMYVNTADLTPNEDIFLEVPSNPNLMIHLANGSLDDVVFQRIVDNLSWNPKTNNPKNPIPSTNPY